MHPVCDVYDVPSPSQSAAYHVCCDKYAGAGVGEGVGGSAGWHVSVYENGNARPLEKGEGAHVDANGSTASDPMYADPLQSREGKLVAVNPSTPHSLRVEPTPPARTTQPRATVDATPAPMQPGSVQNEAVADSHTPAEGGEDWVGSGVGVASHPPTHGNNCRTRWL